MPNEELHLLIIVVLEVPVAVLEVAPLLLLSPQDVWVVLVIVLRHVQVAVPQDVQEAVLRGVQHVQIVVKEDVHLLVLMLVVISVFIIVIRIT